MNRIVIALLYLYQKTLSLWIGQNCRFHPTCSNYAIECYQHFNFFKASFYTIYRLIRCQPFSKGGFDPIPLRKNSPSLKADKIK